MTDMTERVQEAVARLRRADEYEPLGHDAWEAADLLEAIAARLAEVKAERDHWKAVSETLSEMQAGEYARAEAAEAEVARLRALIAGAEARAGEGE